MWYLTEELVTLSLFSDSISVEQKRKIVEVLMSYKASLPSKSLKRCGLGFGKPTLPQLPYDTLDDISSFAGEESWRLFPILNLDTDFLEKPVAEWNLLPSYVRDKKKLLIAYLW
jgi:hypothetical protein